LALRHPYYDGCCRVLARAEAPPMDLTPSRYNILIPLRNGEALVYNSLRANFVRLTVHEAHGLEAFRDGRGDSVPNDVVTQLEDDGFVVKKGVDELKLLRDQYEAHRFNPDAVILTIAPTMACNFGCDYCFQGQNKPSETMGMHVQDAIVDYVEQSAERGAKSLGVTWYGGEPLLRRNVIDALSERLMATADQNGMNYSGMIVTNGYKLDLETARALARNRITVAQITLDGTPEYHDSRRYLLGGQGSFERILRNLEQIIDEVPINFSVRVNIDDRNHNDIKRLIDYMAELGLGHRTNLQMYFAPVEALTEGCHSVSDVTLGKAAYGDLETELYRHGYRAGLVPLPYPPRFHGTCGAVRPNGIVVLPNGDVHKCWDTVSWPEKKTGSILDLPNLSKSPIHAKWIEWTPFDNETCKNCKLLPNCSGACAYKFVHAQDTRGEAAVLPCPSWKYNIKERLAWRAIALGAITKDDIDPTTAATVPAELCADDVIAGGKPLPPEMQAHYDKQKRHLPVLRG
jgi:uncharacterized protein